MKRKITAIVAMLAMVLSLLPLTALPSWAAEGEVEYLYCDENGQNWETRIKSTGEYTSLTKEYLENKSYTLQSGWYVVEPTADGITVDRRINISGAVHLILADDASLTVNGGISLYQGNNLTIYGQHEGDGSLIVRNVATAEAGLGCRANNIAGNITINGGHIEATGGEDGAGIGGGYKSSAGTIIINRGSVKATGGRGAAGIGGGYSGSGGTVIINGGIVEAIRGGGYGIGSGSGSASGAPLSTGENGHGVIITDSINNRNEEANWSGVFFIGSNDGEVYGNVELADNFTLASDQTLTVGADKSLSVKDGVTLVNKGSILVSGALSGHIDNQGTIYQLDGGMVSDEIDGKVVISGKTITYLDESGIEQLTEHPPIPVTPLTTALSNGWYVVASDVTLNKRLTVTGDVYLILADDAKLTVNGGIQVQGGNSLTIYGQSTGTQKGQLIAQNVEEPNAGIGGNSGDAGKITINGGAVTATGGEDGAGIGGGYHGGGGTVIINGGFVTATGGKDGAGIGSGWGTSKGNFSTSAKSNAVIFTSSIRDESKKDDWNGIFFIGGNDGQVYGNVTLAEAFTITSEQILTIGEGQTLTIPDGVTLTNEGTIINNGTIVGSIDGSGEVHHASRVGVHFEKNGETVTSVAYGDEVTVVATIQKKQATTNSLSADEDTVNFYLGDTDGTLLASENVTNDNDGTYTAKVTIKLTGDNWTPNETPYTITADFGGTTDINGDKLQASTGHADLTVTKLDQEALTIENVPATIYKGDSFALSTDGGSVTGDVKWSVEGDVATIDTDGKVTVTEIGEFTVKAEKAGDAIYNPVEACVTLTATNRPSSGGGTITPPTYPPTVTEPENGSVTTSPARPKQGETVTITPDPDDGYEVDKITVTDKNGKTVDVEKNSDGTYTFTQPSGKVTITVTYREAGEEPEPTDLPFTDVSEGAWYIDPVRFVYNEGLMTGTSTTTFSPNLTTTRGMIVAILYRMEGEPDLSNENLGYPFADVDASAYYGNAVYWARQNGIVSGYSSERFGPTDSITREQLAAILYNVAEYKGVDTSARNDLSSYSDAGSISGWATDAMQWANAAGIVNGMSESELAPKGNATRAQVAAMLERYVKNVLA
ncbi:MAG: S-layer homology domain-containing protein [Peptococcaceae bacterium]|nr:S-layer homology domain-containing protein [Peptococcaceae bacterium]